MAEEREIDDSFRCIGIVSAVAGTAVILLSLIAFLLQQTFHLPAPRCYVRDLYVPALDLTAAPANASSNATINPILFFALQLRNNLNIRSVSYNDIGLTFYYGRKAVASAVVPGFYQGSLRTAQRRGVVDTRGVPWEDALRAVSAGSTAGFRVELAAQPRFKVLFWYSKVKKVRVAADVAVDASGMKAVGYRIRLN